ncbi:MAG: hypothetical protein ACM3N4_08005 [Nitrososphaerota archaeon]
MSWYALSHGFVESGDRTNAWMPIRLLPAAPSQPLDHAAPGRSLGTATADARWRWASPRAGRVITPADARVEVNDDDFDDVDDVDDVVVATGLRITRDLRDEMAEMAHVLGRSEDDLWAEAAREWLMRRLRNDEPPPTTPAAAPAPSPRTRRLWSEIDAVLADLRHPRYVTAPAEPTVPAA